MYLYHGTSERVAKDALQNGLKTRATSGTKTNWQHTVPSRDDLVYLTDAYAPYFAMVACERPVDGRWAVIKVDLSVLVDGRLYPDEDFIEQAMRMGYNEQDGGENQLVDMLMSFGMRERTEWIRDNIEVFQENWKASLEGIGNVAVLGDIPAEAIVEVSYFDKTKNPLMFQCAGDPTISILNYKFMAPKYRAITDWFMGTLVTWKQFNGALASAMERLTDDEVRQEQERWLKDTSALEIEMNDDYEGLRGNEKR